MLLVLLAVALPLGAWFVVAPALATRTAAPPEPPVDLEMPAKNAPLATASAASGASAAQAALASASAASGAVDDKARCGEDQVAQYRDPEPDADGVVRMYPAEPDPDGVVRRYPNETKAAGVGYTGALRRVDAALRSTGDPFDQTVADALNIGGLQSQQARIAAVVLDAQSSRDPRVESLAFSTCAMAMVSQAPVPAMMSCAKLNIRDWARDDRGNGVPWLYALQQAEESGDRVAQREALRELASADRFESGFGAAAAAVARVKVASDADLTAQSELSMQALVLGLGAPFTPLTSRCRDKAGGDTEMAAMCESIALRMIDHSDGALSMTIGASIHKQVTGDATRLEKARRELREFGERWQQKDSTTPCVSEREVLQKMRQIGEHGEVALMRELAKAPRHPRDAASR